MTKNIKITAAIGQVLFAWLYSSSTNYCHYPRCTANSWISFILILVCFVFLDLYFLKLYPRFKNISSSILIGIALSFPLLFYLVGLILNALTAKSLSVVIVGLVIVIVSRILWALILRGKIFVKSPKLTEYAVLSSLFMLILGAGFLVANLNFAISSYLKYINVSNDIYIVGNGGKKSNFINYKFR